MNTTIRDIILDALENKGYWLLECNANEITITDENTTTAVKVTVEVIP